MKELQVFQSSPHLHDPLLASSSPEKKEMFQKDFQNFYKAGIQTYKQYSKRWFQTPLLFGAVADPRNFRTVAAALLLGYLKELERTQVSRFHSLFFLCLKPAIKFLWKERNLQFLCLVEIMKTELTKSREKEGLQNFWTVMDRKETILALFDLLQSTRAKAVKFFKESNTALAEWIQTCIFAAPHQNKSVEGSFNILDQILQIHPSLSPSKIESIQSFLLNVVNPKKQQFIKKEWKGEMATYQEGHTRLD
jgi:hypothetical protein